MKLNFILILSFCFCLVGCGGSEKDYELDARSFTSQHLKMVEQSTGVVIPTGSLGMNMYYGQAQIDPSFIAKIEIPATSSESVFKQIERIPVEDGRATNPFAQKVTWWNPSKATIRIERVFIRNPSGDFVKVLLCDEAGHWILYIYWASV